MNAFNLATRALLCGLAAFAVGSLSGCACYHGNAPCDDVCFNCYGAWPCFGYHSTCWHPWPEECVACPSPFITPGIVTEKSLMPGETPGPMPESREFPLPMPPVPANDANAPPAPTEPNLPPVTTPEGEASSRRRPDAVPASYESNYSLGALRWAPADSR